MKTIIEKQILEWKEELTRQKTTKEQAEKVLMETNRAILLIEGGIQAKEMLLKKIESADQPAGIVELNQGSGKAPSKK